MDPAIEKHLLIHLSKKGCTICTILISFPAYLFNFAPHHSRDGTGYNTWWEATQKSSLSIHLHNMLRWKQIHVL